MFGNTLYSNHVIVFIFFSLCCYEHYKTLVVVKYIIKYAVVIKRNEKIMVNKYIIKCGGDKIQTKHSAS